jgi:Uma2 family endonuclease
MPAMTFTSRFPEPPRQRMSGEVFLAWTETQDGRYELVDGVIYAQASEHAAHVEMKLAVAVAFMNAIRKSGLSCHVLPDGMAMRIGAQTVLEPDASVYCRPEAPPDTLLVENAVIVVEVIWPTTGRNDRTRKLAGYFNLPTVQHDLIVDPDDALVVRHQRGDDGVVRSYFHTEGEVKLDSPGLTLALAEIYPAS